MTPPPTKGMTSGRSTVQTSPQPVQTDRTSEFAAQKNPYTPIFSGIYRAILAWEVSSRVPLRPTSEVIAAGLYLPPMKKVYFAAASATQWARGKKEYVRKGSFCALFAIWKAIRLWRNNCSHFGKHSQLGLVQSLIENTSKVMHDLSQQGQGS